MQKHAVQKCRWGYALGKPYITVESAEADAKLRSSRSPCRKITYVQNAKMSSDTVPPGPHIEDEVDRTCHNIMDSKTTLLCQESHKSSLEVRIRVMHVSRTDRALVMPENLKVKHNYSLRPRKEKV